MEDKEYKCPKRRAPTQNDKLSHFCIRIIIATISLLTFLYHKAILASRSPFFYKMFTPNNNNNNNSKIILNKQSGGGGVHSWDNGVFAGVPLLWRGKTRDEKCKFSSVQECCKINFTPWKSVHQRIIFFLNKLKWRLAFVMYAWLVVLLMKPFVPTRKSAA